MTIPPQLDKEKNTKHPFIREEINDTGQGCLRGLIVFIGLLLLFGLILFVMSQLG